MIYVISDLHGYPHESFLKLLEKAGFSDNDFLYVLGDVIDRNGDGGVETLRWIMKQQNVELILGNHEAMLLACSFLFEEITDESLKKMDEERLSIMTAYIQNGGDITLDTMKKLSREEQQEILDFLRSAPTYRFVRAGGRKYILVHAGLHGFRADKKLSKYAPGDLIWYSPKIGDKYYPNATTVFGHTPTFTYGEGYRGTTVRTSTWICIDAGAAYGEKAVLLRLDDLREFR